jgi:DNA polymerase III subunit beta
MRCTISTKNLKSSLNNLSRIASSRSTLPILANILFKAENNHVYLSATDLTIGMEVFVGAKVSEEGVVTIPARVFNEYIANIQEETVEISYKDNRVTIKTKHHETLVGSMQAEDFPELPVVEGQSINQISTEIFKSGIQKVIHSASVDSTKPVLNSVYIVANSQSICFAATDGYRLSEYITPQTGLPEINITLPIKSAQELIKVLPEKGTIDLQINPQLLEVKAEDVTFITRLIEGAFPKYKALIPKETANSAVLDKADLASTIKLASIFSREQSGSTTLYIDEESQELVVTTQATQTGQSTSKITAVARGDATITVNSRYISEALLQIESKKVSLGFNEKLQPCVIKGLEEDNFTQIIMPLKG